MTAFPRFSPFFPSRFPAKNNAVLYVRALLKVMLHGKIRNDDF